MTIELCFVIPTEEEVFSSVDLTACPMGRLTQDHDLIIAQQRQYIRVEQ